MIQLDVSVFHTDRPMSHGINPFTDNEVIITVYSWHTVWSQHVWGPAHWDRKR